jgi:hypothetical protein
MADVTMRWWVLRQKPVDLGVGPVAVVGTDRAGDHHIAAFGEVADSLVSQRSARGHVTS